MYKVDRISKGGFNFLELKNTTDNSLARICLEEGGRLQELKFKGVDIIKEQPNFDYTNSYASAILFPFANRIENGKYTFNDKKFQFDCNNNTNALHGLVYNKKFKFLEKELSSNNCSVTIYYSEEKGCRAFPYTYSIFLTYTLSKEKIELNVTIKNEDFKAFPFTLGWHPYFVSENLQASSLNFKATKKVVFDENLITKKLENYNNKEVFEIENKKLDDCFILKNNKIQFSTPTYKIQLSSNSKETFLQLYTPKNIPTIAIEPMTGISNSFNNKIGLQILKPNEEYKLIWNVAFNKKIISV